MDFVFIGAGLAIASAIALWLCRAKDGRRRVFLAGGLDVWAAALITAGLGFGISVMIANIAHL
jgi:hypothetical protein